MSGANSWLQRQRKTDLAELAQYTGLKKYVLEPNAIEITHCKSNSSFRCQSYASIVARFLSRFRCEVHSIDV